MSSNWTSLDISYARPFLYLVGLDIYNDEPYVAYVTNEA
jgi:hypothetical protein